MKRVALLLILFLAFAGAPSIRAVHAQTPPTQPATQPATQGYNPAPNPEEYGKIVDDKAKAGQTSKEIYSFNTQVLLSNGVTCMIRGCSSDPKSGFYYGKSAVAQVNNMITAMYMNPPGDLALWIRDTGESLGFIPKQAYAQGIGFTGLSVLLPIWKAFRNISYALLAVIMVIIGFMVMFRKKIDPKTVVTVQNALPRIVLALILVTFSYAIAAFFIDLMYVAMAIVINLIVGASPGAFGADTASKYMAGGIGTVIGAMFGGGLSSIDDLVHLIFYNGDTPWLTWVLNVATIGIYPAAQWVLTSLIVAVALIFGIVRVAFMLISAYIQIIVAVLIAPFQLMTEAIPGSSSFSSWTKNLFSNLVVFPVTAAMMLVGTLLTQSNAGRIWTPPLLSPQGAEGISGLIGLGILMTIPSIAGGIKEALKAKAPVEAGMGAILGPVGAGAGQLMQVGYQASFISSAFRGGHGKPEKPDLPAALEAAKNPGGPITGQS